MTTKIVNGERVQLTDAEEQELVDRKARSDAGVNDQCWKSIRQTRDKRLQETGHFALNDLTLTDEMKTYRAALRNLPANISDSLAFVTQWSEFENGKDGVSDPWPTKPS